MAPPARAVESASSHELPSDLSALARILESAMLSEAPEESAREGWSDPKPQGTTNHPTIQLSNYPTAEPAVEKPLAKQPPAAASEGEAAAFDEVARSLAAAEACVPLLAQSTGLLRIAALDVVKAETARAGGLLQLLRFLRGDLVPPITSVSANAVVQRVAQALESERRLRSVALTTRSSVVDATCSGDETLLANMLLSLLLATFAAVDGVPNARVMLSVTVSDAGEIGFAVSQDHVPPPAESVVGSIALSAAHRIAWQWRGRFAVASGDHSSIMTLWLPTFAPNNPESVAH